MKIEYKISEPKENNNNKKEKAEQQHNKSQILQYYTNNCDGCECAVAILLHNKFLASAYNRKFSPRNVIYSGLASSSHCTTHIAENCINFKSKEANKEDARAKEEPEKRKNKKKKNIHIHVRRKSGDEENNIHPWLSCLCWPFRHKCIGGQAGATSGPCFFFNIEWRWNMDGWWFRMATISYMPCVELD